jgi:hypothetical protein
LALQSGVFNIILRGSFSIGLLTRVQQRRVSVHGIAIAIAIVAGLCTKNKNNHPTSALHATCCMLLNGPLSLSLFICVGLVYSLFVSMSGPFLGAPFHSVASVSDRSCADPEYLRDMRRVRVQLVCVFIEY